MKMTVITKLVLAIHVHISLNIPRNSLDIVKTLLLL